MSAAFNRDQLQAIGAENPNLLISAAAGSGKTTVMVARIVRELIQTEKTLDQFLIITFTKDAAEHMRRKLETELAAAAAAPDGEPEARLRARRALQALDSAAISTIHAFCMNLIREHFDQAGVSADVKAIDPDLPDRLFEEACIEAANEALGQEDAQTPADEPELPESGRDAGAIDRKAVAVLFSALKQDEVLSALRGLYNTLMGIPRPFETLRELLRDPAAAWAEEVRRGVSLDLAAAEGIAALERQWLSDPLTPDRCAPVLEADLEIIRDFLAWDAEPHPDGERIEMLEAVRDRFPGMTLRGCPPESKALYEEMKEARKRLKGADSVFTAAAKTLRSLSDPQTAADNARITLQLRGLEQLLLRTEAAYRRAKQRIASVDFSDMEQLAYRLLQEEEIRREMQERYTEIYVDESQDISAIQDAIIQTFRGPGRRVFMVGDIKQSIYRFRHAEPELFDRKRRAYLDGAEAAERRIFFRDNYRSCRAVIDCVNQTFASCMARRITELDYEPEDWLRSNREGEFGPVEVHLIDRGAENETADMLEAQCREAAEIINRLCAEGYRYRDIAILLRSASADAPKMTEFFRRMHIPATYDGPRSFYGLTEIAAFLNLLGSIENEQSDIELYGTLKNLPFLFTDEELADVRLQRREGAYWEAFRFCADRNALEIDRRCRQVREQLARWRKESRERPLPAFLWNLMRETGFYASRGAYPDGALRQANLDALYQKSLKLAERGAVRLADFLEEIRRIRIESGRSEDAPAVLGPEDDLVRIMTMHSSKGLEFPAVILMNLQRELQMKENRSPLRVELGGREPLGLYMPMCDMLRHTRRNTFGKQAFDYRARRNAIAEDTRLLYVAMTRAEKRLFLLGACRRKQASLWNIPDREARIWQTRSMLDIIMPAALAGEPLPESEAPLRRGDWEIVVSSARAVAEREAPVPEAFRRALESTLRAAPGEKPAGLLIPEKPDPAPLKTSVSSLVRTARLAEVAEEETVEIKRRPETAPVPFRLSEIPEKPAFLSEEVPGAADIGTAAHRLLRLLDFRALSDAEDLCAAVREQADRLLAEGVFSGDEAELLRPEQAAAFLATPLGRRLMAAREVHREWPFTLQLQPDRPTMVQGIIDAAFREDGEWILIDYKTDRDTAEASFVPRHAMQMNWYRLAVERITGVRVREMWLAALRDAKTYRVARMDPTVL